LRVLNGSPPLSIANIFWFSAPLGLLAIGNIDELHAECRQNDRRFEGQRWLQVSKTFSLALLLWGGEWRCFLVRLLFYRVHDSVLEVFGLGWPGSIFSTRQCPRVNHLCGLTFAGTT
jgi:hypothetical protein